MKVKKAIIPAAGLGTRFLPATKAQPKEMLPIVDKPTIQYIVEEACNSGIEDIIIVTGRGKRAIEDHFDKSYELEQTLAEKENYSLLQDIQAISNLANIHYIRQKEPLGLGHAIACTSSFIGNEPFAVLLGDDIIHADTPCLKQLIDVYEKYQSPVIGVQKVPDHLVSKYGIIEPEGEELEKGVLPIHSLIEKPKVAEAPSNYAIMGRYILTPEIFPILHALKPGANNEIQLTDALVKVRKQRNMLAFTFDGIRYDIGDKLGFVKATVDFALRHEDMREDMLEYLKKVVEKGERG